MTIRFCLWLPLGAALAALPGCAPPLSQPQLAAQAARVQTGRSIIDMQLNTPPPPDAGMSGAEASAIWKAHLAELGKPQRNSERHDRQGGAGGFGGGGMGGGY
jgi:hypothetical protein